MDEIINKRITMDLSVSYYDDNTRISNSSIGWYLISPIYFFKAMNGEGEKFEASFLRSGTMIHMYLLQYEEFWKNYRISNANTPSSAQQKSFAENYVKSKEKNIKSKALEAYKNSYAVKGKSDDKIQLEADELISKIGDYIKELMEKDPRERINFYEHSTLKTIEENIKFHKKANTLIYNFNPGDEVYSEFHINWVDEETGVECKSLIDRLIINHKTKEIKLVDLKTTNKIHDFKSSMIEYGYFRQMAFYKRAIFWYFKYILELDPNEYSFQTYIVAISTNDKTKNEIRVFSITDEDKKEYDKLISNILTKIKWHNTMNYKEGSYDYYNNEGIDIL